MNPLAKLLQMSPEIMALQDPATAQRPGQYYQALAAMQGMPLAQQPATDWENEENMRRYMEAGANAAGGPPAPLQDMWMRREPGAERMWEYGQDGTGPIGDIGYETDEGELRDEGWAPVLEYIDEQISLAQENGREPLPRPVRLKLEQLLKR